LGAGADAFGQLANLGLHRGHARLQIVGLIHDQ
jgi:hypothetical protein